MKWIYSADWHIRFSNPRIRIDDYSLVQFNKIKWICEFANEMGAAILVAGDIFDKPMCPTVWQYLYAELFLSVDKGVYVIYGQHDIHFHNPNLTKTPLGVLLVSNVLKHANEVMDTCDFGGDIPECSARQLCIHTPITQYDPPFFMEDAVSSETFLKNNTEWNYIISGDFHEQFISVLDGKILFNPGPIMRTAKDKIGFSPKVILHDTVKKEWKWISIPIEQDVFNLDLMDKDDRTDYKDKLREFAGTLDSNSTKQNFRENLRVVINKVKPKEETLEILDTVLEET